MISREIAKQESSSTTDNNNNSNNNNNDNNSNNISSLKAATTSWSRLKDPRIVRVSRAFGGKDRHSKVCTVRGLRDRRVRLSVPTAIQLYDLQDRLGLNQPSKVVDWLLNAAKAEIDELPPLQFPHPTMLDNLNNQLDLKSKDHQDHHHHSYLNQNQNQNQNPSSSTTSNIPFNSSFVRWDPSTLTLSHPPRSPNCSSSPHQQPAAEDWHNFSLVQPHHHHHHHQVLVYQPAAAMAAQPYFQSQISASNADFSPSVEASTHFNIITANLLPSQNNDGSR